MASSPPFEVTAAEGTLTKEEIERFSRQIMIEQIGVDGMVRIRRGRVCCVGMGGLGSTIALYLAAGGVGQLTLVDFDTVELSNLHRQVIHTTSRVGDRKAESARAAALAVFPQANIVAATEALTPANAEAFFTDCDVVIDGTDNVAARYVINDAAMRLRKPLVSGSAMRWEGQLTVYGYQDGPCYRCLFPQPPPAAAVGSCNDTGVVGPVPGMIGCLQALEALKLLAGTGEILSGRLLLFDGLRATVRTVRLRPRQADTCTACGSVTLAGVREGTAPPLWKMTESRPEYLSVGCAAPHSATAHAAAAAFGTSRCSPVAFAALWSKRSAEDWWPSRTSDRIGESSPGQAGARARWSLCVDVRVPVQFNMCHLPGSFSLPLDELQRWKRDGTLSARLAAFLAQAVARDVALRRRGAPHRDGGTDAAAVGACKVFFLCRRGIASLQALELVAECLQGCSCLISPEAYESREGFPSSGSSEELPFAVTVVNVDGGLNAFHWQVDPDFPLY